MIRLFVVYCVQWYYVTALHVIAHSTELRASKTRPTVRYVVDSVQVPLTALVKHVLPISSHQL